MMRLTLLLVALGASLASAQFNRPRNTFNQARNDVPILVDERNGPDEYGNFDFRYETGDGIYHQAQGNPVGDKSFAVQGSYSYTSPEGELVEVRYVADENGFQADSPHLPVAPPMPAHALAQVRAAERAFASQRAGGRSQQPRPSSNRRGNFNSNPNRRNFGK